MWQEVREGERRSIIATGKQRKTGVGNVTWRPEEGHLTPEVNVANEIICDYVWDKLYPPHFYNLL
jgi:hypothetical protein